MTRKDVEFLSYHEMFTGFRDLLLAHDAEQRSIIDEQVEESRGLRADVKLMQTANAEYRQEIVRLRELLGQLHGLQNGCPLPKYEKDWLHCMEQVERLLCLDKEEHS
jgi:predicted secreted protein